MSLLFYDSSPRPDLLSQGDIIKDFIFLDPPAQTFIVRNLPDGIISNDLADEEKARLKLIANRSSLVDSFAEGKEAVVVDAVLTKVAVVSQSCDIDRKPFLSVAAVRPIALVGNAEKQELVRKRSNKVFGTFWLPAFPHLLEESYVDLSLIFSVRNEVLKAKLSDRVLGLLPSSRQILQWSLVQHFGRPAED